MPANGKVKVKGNGKGMREPSSAENFRHGGRSARGLEVRRKAPDLYVMVESHVPQGKAAGSEKRMPTRR